MWRTADSDCDHRSGPVMIATQTPTTIPLLRFLLEQMVDVLEIYFQIENMAKYELPGPV